MRRGRRRYYAGPMMMGRRHCGGPSHGRGRGWLSIDDEIAMLEETQRDLEEAAAEVAERIRRLKDKEEQPAKA
jgi:hypothetical protein